MQRQVQIHHSDIDSEFIGKSLQALFVCHGILHRLYCLGTPEQIGLAERKRRHIVETGLTLLAHSHLESTFWSHAYSTTVYLINPLPTSVLFNKSPYKILFKLRPDYSLLQIFGSLHYPRLSPFGRSKLQMHEYLLAIAPPIKIINVITPQQIK